ncbi:MAG: hypothetical protein IT427_02955 [Pirellulales bacterium]|nr:hypothetical protein [Pirellulales bacterium]
MNSTKCMDAPVRLGLADLSNTLLDSLASRNTCSGMRGIRALIGLFACCATFSAIGAEPMWTQPSVTTAAAKRPPADWGTSRKLRWQPSRNSAADNLQKNESVRSVKYEEDVFGDGPALQGKAGLTSAAHRVAQVPKSPFDVEKSTPSTPPPSPEPFPPPAPMESATPSAPTPPTPMPSPTNPPSFEATPPTTTPPPAPAPPTPASPAPTPSAESPLELPRTPATNPPGIFLEPPQSQFDLDFPRRPIAQINPAEDCKAAYAKLQNNTLDKLSLDIHVAGKPGDDIPYECTLTDDPFDPRCWNLTTYTWKASALCHKPISFEEEALERYGHSHGPGCEYLVSFAHFFGNVVLLPYHMGVDTPTECIYDLGVYRAGSCAPYMIDPFPISLRGAAFGAVGYSGAVALFP